MAPPVPFFLQGSYELMVIEMPQNVVDLNLALSFPLDHLKQMWLVRHMVVNSSTNLLRLQMGGPSNMHWRPTLTNMEGGSVLFLPAGAPATTNSFEHTTPEPLLSENTGCGAQNVTLRVRLTDSTGSQTGLTHDRVVLWFAVQMADPSERWMYTTLDTPERIMGTRTY